MANASSQKIKPMIANDRAIKIISAGGMVQLLPGQLKNKPFSFISGRLQLKDHV